MENCGKFEPPYPGKATVTARAALPCPKTACSVFAFNVRVPGYGGISGEAPAKLTHSLTYSPPQWGTAD